MLTRETVARRLQPVYEILAGAPDPMAARHRYWQIRGQMFDEGEIDQGPGWDFMSNIDTAMDVFSADDETRLPPPFHIDLPQLREELTAALEGLRALGLVDPDVTAPSEDRPAARPRAAARPARRGGRQPGPVAPDVSLATLRGSRP